MKPCHPRYLSSHSAARLLVRIACGAAFVCVLALVAASDGVTARNSAPVVAAAAAALPDGMPREQRAYPAQSATPISTATATATPIPPCGVAWRLVPSPNIGTHVNGLLGMDVVAPNDIWAVGGYRDDNFDFHHQIQHWNGAEWSTVSSPLLQDSELYDISAVSATDIWAVGTYNGEGDTLTMHWDGTSWTHVPSPNVGSGRNILFAVHAISATDVWAVGFRWTGLDSNGAPSADVALTLHWNGTTWSIVPTPSTFPSDNYLNDVAAVAPNDVWAVGVWRDDQAQVYRTLVIRWDGSQWNVIPSPSPGTQQNRLNSIHVFSSSDIWAVGSFDSDPNPEGTHTLTMHWDGTQWDVVPSPNLDNTAHILDSITATSPTDIWAVGNYGQRAGGPLSLPLSMHWDGGQWSIVPVPVTEFGGRLLASVGMSSTDVWAVGQYYDEETGYTLTHRYYDPCTVATPTPTPTATVTSTATATPTACAITFTDVPPDNHFYPWIRCLACRFILSGYPDGTFRPGNAVTRGQIAKIVSNAAGLTGTPDGQTYEDVLPTHTFYVWIERLTDLGVMSGYPCGQLPSEQCVPPGNRPYFRPQNNATRGQLSKIVAEAAGVEGTPTTRTYADVLFEDPFYLWIERLTALGVMGGYPCGSVPGEPCDAQQRPYFRPNNNVTRAQAAKIVANTFFAGECGALAARR